MASGFFRALELPAFRYFQPFVRNSGVLLLIGAQDDSRAVPVKARSRSI